MDPRGLVAVANYSKLPLYAYRGIQARSELLLGRQVREWLLEVTRASTGRWKILENAVYLASRRRYR